MLWDFNDKSNWIDILICCENKNGFFTKSITKNITFEITSWIHDASFGGTCDGTMPAGMSSGPSGKSTVEDID